MKEIEAALVGHLDQFCDQTPLEIVLRCFETHAGTDEARRFLQTYNTFLEVVGDHEKREWLKLLDPSKAIDDEVFGTIRRASHEYQACLDLLFLNGDNDMSRLTRKYGVF